jgi:putative tryptophan/tyrosine transport system substrate-binding protein
MMHRRTFLIALLAAPASAAAQNRRFRIGWLFFGGAAPRPIDQSLKDALAERGLIDGGNIEIIYRYANGAPARLAELAGELVAQQPDMLLGVGGDVAKALFEASKGGIPIVGGVATTPCGRGWPRLLPGRARISPA